jgi:NADH:ubiquinone oxidoreductase subunit 6 (subunit J)
MSKKRIELTERDRELRRREWLMIYLPLFVGVVLALSLVITISILGLTEVNLGSDPASVWGDTAAIVVSLEVAVISLAFLAVLVLLCALVIWLIAKAHPLLKRGQEITGQVSQKVDELADTLVTAFIKPYSLSARMRAIGLLFRR